ncbi:MAG: hypothetical protein QNJ94_13585 [Alphaproteobacteria bacterium]|nr:hypothetical protein [Alphaproteobacteria bacterium]
MLDVVEIIAGHVALTGGGRGRPARRQGQAITRSGVVVLCAAMEQYLEDLFKEAAPLIYPTATADELERLFSATADKLNHPSLHAVTVMYFSIGMNHPFSKIRWPKMPNPDFQRTYNKFLETRGQIAHGRQPTVRLATLRSWKTMVELSAIRLERLVADHIEERTGNRPAW